MDKFSKMSNKKEIESKDSILYKNDNISVEEINNQYFINQTDSIVCIPYFTEYNQIMLLQESNQIFASFGGQENNISVIETNVVENEDMKVSLMKYMESKLGIVLRDKFPIEFDKPLFQTKNSNKKCFFTIIPVSESDYHEVLVRNDIDAPKKVKVDVKFINKLYTSDVTTELMMIKLKKYLNII